MLEFQGVSSEVANKLCNSDCIEKNVLPSAQFTTQIKSNEEGLIKLIDASMIARYVSFLSSLDTFEN